MLIFSVIVLIARENDQKLFYFFNSNLSENTCNEQKKKIEDLKGYYDIFFQ